MNSHSQRSSARAVTDARGYTLLELLITMAITTVILGSTMVAMNDANRATISAQQIADLNNGLRTAMDLMVRDLLQVGQGLPGGRAILIPNGGGAQPVQLPGPPGTDYTLDGPSFCPPAANDPDTICEYLDAVVPGPARGPALVEDGPLSDMITTIAADSSFESVPLRSFAADGRSVVVPLPCPAPPTTCPTDRHPLGVSISETGAGADTSNNIRPGDLIMLSKGSASTLVQVSSVNVQTINFAAGDSLKLNQAEATNRDGTALDVRNMAPIDVLPSPQTNPPTNFITTVATRIRMISYYVDATTDPKRPRLVRRMNNGSWNSFNNESGTTVAFDIEGLQISYDLSDGRTNVKMDDADYSSDGTGKCGASPCYPSQIRKVNIALSGRSQRPRPGTQNHYYRTRLVSQVSLRSLAFVDRYR